MRLAPDAGNAVYSLTLANVDSLRAWLNADIGPANGDKVSTWGIGIIATC